MTAGVEPVRELRERTGAGIMDCKAALLASSGDMEKAVDFLRKKGVASASKRAGREAKEGIIGSIIQGGTAVLVEANCETDFVARTEDFRALVDLAIAEISAQGEGAILGPKVSERVAELSGKIGEKIVVRRAKKLQSAGAFFSYIHANQKLGVVVELISSKKGPALESLGKDLAMQVAASNPICVSRGEVPAQTVEREKGVYREEVKGKPDNIVEKIITGKLEKFYQNVCLLEQMYIKDDKKSVKILIEEAGKQLGDVVQVKQFVRFQLGESVAL